MINSFLLAINKVAFTIGSLEIAWYGIIVTSAILAAFFLFLFLANKCGIDMDFSLELFIWLIILAVFFCRFFFVVGHEYFWPIESWDDFLELFNIRAGGLTIVGGVFGGALAVFICCIRNKKYSFAKVADCVVIALLLGQIIGRWGNFFNQELFGTEITNPAWQWFPFGVYIDRLGGWYHALFFYEGTLNAIGLTIALVLFFKFRDKIKPFTISLFYFMWYGLVRGSLEFLKYDKANFGDSNIGYIQVICIVGFFVAILLQVLLQKGIISFETKWFKRLCEEQKVKDAKKLEEQALKEEENNKKD